MAWDSAAYEEMLRQFVIKDPVFETPTQTRDSIRLQQRLDAAQREIRHLEQVIQGLQEQPKSFGRINLIDLIKLCPPPRPARQLTVVQRHNPGTDYFEEKVMDIMLDLETMGRGPNAAIIAIGAVAFDLDNLMLTNLEFYQTIDLESAVAAGGVITPATVLWWMQQEDEARAEFFRGSDTTIVTALTRFESWFGMFSPDIGVWGNGANFDNVVLRSAYERSGLQAPWSFRSDRCFRTARALLPEVEIKDDGVEHNALHDARWQARYLIEATRAARKR